MAAVSRRFDNNPSFSSTLLDQIYRSIDETNDGAIKSNRYRFDDDYDDRRAFLIQKLIQNNKLCKKTETLSCSEGISRAAVKPSKYRIEGDYGNRRDCYSSECDSRAAEIESVYGIPSRPKHIRTNVKLKHENEESIMKGKSMKTKSKAFKIYSDLKKVKQPISPGGRLSSFLHSIFTGKSKNSNTVSEGYTSSSLDRKSKSANASTCSSTSSFSRSCLSNNSSSRGNGLKRSVRFYPVSVIVDEDCGEKSLHEQVNKNSNEKKRQISKSTRNLLKKIENEIKIVDEEEDGFESESSSDLFELDNLSLIGLCNYRQELPVYETTYVDTNRAIANGRFM